MAVTTTTSSVRVVRESLAAWPRLANLAVPPTLAVMSLDVAGYDHPTGAAVAAEAFARAVAATVDAHAFAALVRLGSIDLASRITRYRLEKEGVWRLLGPDEFSAYAGARSEWLDESASRAHYGALQLRPGDLPRALAATRTVDSVVVCGRGERWAGAVYPTSRQVGSGLLEATVALLPHRYTFVARAYGTFGEASSGVDVVADESLLDSLAAAVFSPP